MANVDVVVLRRKVFIGAYQVRALGTAQTNDLGEYRIGGLLAGKYYRVGYSTCEFSEPGARQRSTGGAMRVALANTCLRDRPSTQAPSDSARKQRRIEVHAGEETPVDFAMVPYPHRNIRGSVAGVSPGTKAVGDAVSPKTRSRCWRERSR